MSGILPWLGFVVIVAALLAVDLGVFHRRSHRLGLREAGLWSAVWVSLALAFGAGVWLVRGADSGLQFLTGYLIELSLSVDNVFLFAVIFSAFRVPARYQHRVLFWGILTAVVLRGIMILGGAALLNRFHWLIYPFGALLLVTGAKMLLKRSETENVEHSPVVGWLQRHVPLVDRFHDDHFFVQSEGRRYATRLFLVLALVEVTDVMFALDSIPAVLAVSRDPFIVFTSNILAILGLRSLYFLLAGVMDRFCYLSYGLAAILILVGLKMMGVVHLPIVQSLLIIAAILATTIVASLAATRRGPCRRGRTGSHEARPGAERTGP